MAKRKKNCRELNGILLIDKPHGLTSNQVLQRVKRIMQACKAGHTGSLDPIATGLLPLCFGEATKVSQFMLDADKQYWVRIKLGEETTTYDVEGEVVAEAPVNVDRRQIEKALKSFTGKISQLPPMYSAVKQGGQALYKLAREGKEVERKPREVTVYRIDLLDFDGEFVELEILCSKGTYVRTIAHDLGKMLGCGGHVVELRRLGVGDFKIDEAVPLEEIEDLESPAEGEQYLLPVDEALLGLPDVTLTSLATHYLLQGQPVTARHGQEPGLVRLYNEENAFLGMGEVLDDGRVAPKRLMCVGSQAGTQ
ncbi:MAG: tRNA pseudouridine(55) synthase TruB [Acidiferrobacterales bacterium]|nr:tRNA pseudouridine(55) synthase TruB [Acidiferrobacterales bacterium]